MQTVLLCAIALAVLFAVAAVVVAMIGNVLIGASTKPHFSTAQLVLAAAKVDPWLTIAAPMRTARIKN